VVVGQDAVDMVDDTRLSLEHARRELEEMERRGMGPRFAQGSDPTAVTSMKRNFKLGETIQRKLRVAQQELIEARARGSRDSERIAQAVSDYKFQMENNSMIIRRQKNIKQFYQEPKGAWKNKKAEIQELEAIMQMLQGSRSGGESGGERVSEVGSSLYGSRK
jgi:hypothetical protein